MFETLKAAWQVPELKKKLLYTAFIIFLFRLGSSIPVPYIDIAQLSTYFDSMSGTALGLMNVFSGGGLSRATIFAMSVTPYINASIIIQLLTIAIPALERLAKDGGEAGKKKMKAAGHADREWYLAVNDATGYGEAATLITGILLMPTTLVVSFILPGNLVLPMLDLVAIPYIIQPFIACSNGNILKSFIGGLIFMIANLYFCTLTGPAFTDVAISTGIDLQGATMVTSLVILGQPVGAIIFLAFLTQNPIIIGAVVVVYVVCYVLVHKNMTAIHEFIENSALNHTTKKVETAA